MNAHHTMQAIPPAGRRAAGAVRTPLLLFIVLAILAGAIAYSVFRAEKRARQCIQHLRHLYLALEMYELDHGTLPHMAFYPDDARYAANSMLVVLDPYAITSEIGLCPGSHEVVREHGLSYIWNANLNGKPLHEQSGQTWLVTELSALSDQVPAPHLGRYITLYADGRIARSRKPPAGLTDVRP